MAQYGKFMERAATRDYSKHWQRPGTFPAIMQAVKPPLPLKDDYPIAPYENYRLCVTGNKPKWMPLYQWDSNIIWPDCIEEHPVPEYEGYDWWGTKWADVPAGMAVAAYTRVINDFEHWEDELEWPDIELPDWKADGKKIQADLDPQRSHIYECVEGIFERLHELIPFDESLLAFYTEPEALDRFFSKMAEYKIETCRKVFENYGRVDGVLYHDDWGTQRAEFFSEEMFREQLMPYTKRVTDFCRSNGMFMELHSCGRNMKLVPIMIEMGFDLWAPQANANDLDVLFEKHNEDMSFAFPVNLTPDMTEEEIRKVCREFVDKYGVNGRIMAWVRAPGLKPEMTAAAREEIHRYSMEYYAKRW